jgi:predicted neuraminidase
MNRREFLQRTSLAGVPLLAPAALFSTSDQGPDLPPMETITVGGREIHPGAPPHGLVNLPDLGIMVNQGMTGQRIYAKAPPDNWCGESRCVKTPGGDYLLMLTTGQHHYGGKLTKVNDMVAVRSSDQGKTWSGPKVAWDIPYNQHGFVPLVPHGSKRIYAFGTEPIFSMFDRPENAPIGFRYSDDDGHTWSEVTLIRPANDPDFRGMFVMRMCETGKGTWLLAPHTGVNYRKNAVTTRLYIMRSADQGASWTLLPHPRPDGWVTPGYDQLEEGRPISLGGTKVLMLARSSEGHLWKLRSDDDGQTWTGPDPTPMVHPLAPPMLFHLNDGKTLASFYHNRNTQDRSVVIGSGMNRSELWVSLSHDEGATWSEPRFVMANSAGGGHMGQFADWSVSYIDLLVEHHVVHIFFSHQFRQVLHVRFDEKLLHGLPTKAELLRLPG